MKQFLMIIQSVLILSLNGFSQAKLTGTVADETLKGVESATVSLLRYADSSLVKISVTDQAGSFLFENISEGKYRLTVTAMGYGPYASSIFELNGDKPSLQLETILLKSLSKELKAVSVVAHKPLIEQKIDRTVINVEAAVTNVGASALEVLEKSPGVTVDKDGNISLKGKQGVQVYIDGKPSYVGGTELVNLLKNMNASQLEQIEIMTNPPAKYDAAGNAGIINIKTKKNKAKGFNGSISASYGQGAYWRNNENLNLNYRSGKFNAFLNYSFGRNNSFNELIIHRSYLKGDSKAVTAMFDQVAFMQHSNTNNDLKLGMDLFLNKKTTVGFVASGFYNPEEFNSFNTSYLKRGDGQLDSIVYSISRMNDVWKNGSANLNFRRQFDSAGRELTADLDYSKYGSHNNQTFVNTSFSKDWVKQYETQLLSNLPLNINIYSARIDYTQPLPKGAKLEAGAKSSYVNTDNAANYFNLINGTSEVDYGKTNRFLYKEYINAAYLNFNRQFGKLGVQTGLRFEHTAYTGHQLGNAQKPDSAFRKGYDNLFPTVFLNYAVGKDHQLGFSFGRRIDRPAYQDLNPFLFFLDNYTYQAGNPFLKPQYTTNFEVSHIYKGWLNTTLNYNRTRDYMNETFEQNRDSTSADRGYATIVRQGNIGTRNSAGVSISAQIPVTKWWNANLYSNYNYTQFKGELYGEPINISASNVLFNMNNQFNFKNGWSAELSGFYQTKGVEGQILLHAMGQLSAGVSKQVMKGKGSIRFNMRDIFYTNNAKGTINFQSTMATFQNRRDSRVGTISFTYRFGKPIKDQRPQRRNGSASDEQNRVKVGNG